MPDPRLQAALDALTDDGPFDWDAAAAAADPGIRETLGKLRLLAAVARASRDDDGDVPKPLPDPPFEWGPLHVVGHLGRGASGVVFRARDPRLDRYVALKLLPLGSSAHHTTAAGIVREGRMLARVHHPHVVGVHGAEQADGYVGIWMELVEGRTLDQIVREDGARPVSEVLATGCAVCEALAAVHEAGLVHGDVKAQNIVRASTGRIVLMDFGAGRDLHVSTSAPLTGTPIYMAPEVLAGAPVSVQSDVYAVGVLLHHLLTGDYPVKARTIGELASERARRPRRAHGVDTPPALVRAIDRALQNEPEHRYPDTRQMAEALRAVGLPRRRARPLEIVSVAVVATLVFGATGWLSLARRANRPPVLSVLAPTLRPVGLPAVMLVGRPAPDGRWLAVTDLQGNVARLDLDGGRLHSLTSDASIASARVRYAEFSSVSPDGQSIAFGWAGSEQPYEVRIVGLDGRSPRTVFSATDVAAIKPFDWWPDGRSLLVAVQHVGNRVTIGRLLPGQQRLEALAAAPGMLPEHASLSPDGRWVAYDAASPAPSGQRDVHIVDVSSKRVTPLVSHVSNDFAPIWSRDGRRLLFLSDRTGALDLWSLAVENGRPRGVPEMVMRSIGRVRVLSLTTTGSLLHQRLTGAADIYLTEPGSDTPTPVAEAFVGTNLSPRWSPDGSSIAYASRRGVVGPQGGATVLVVRDLVRGTHREWTPPLHAFAITDWSRDGSHVLLHGFDDTNRLGLHAFDLADGRLRVLLSGEAAAWPGRYMPSGELVYVDAVRRGVYARDLRSGRDERLLDFTTAGVDGIVGGAAARGIAVSPDGRWLAYSGALTEGGRRVSVLRLVDLRTAAARELTRAVQPESLLFHDWTPDSQHLLVTRRIAEPPQAPVLWRIARADGSSQRLGVSMPALREVSASPRGDRLAFTAGSATLDVWALDDADREP